MAVRLISALPATDDEQDLRLRALTTDDDPAVRSDAALRLGAAYRRTDPAAARRLLLAALEGPLLTRTRALLRLAYVAKEENDRSQAIDHLYGARETAALLRRDEPTDASIVALQIDIATGLALVKEIGDAVGLLADVGTHVAPLMVAGADPDDVWRDLAASVKLRLGQLLGDSDPEAADDALRMAIAWGSGPTKASAALHRGWLLEHKLVGLTPETEEQYRLAVELGDPVLAPLARVSLGDALWRSGRPDVAMVEWRRAAADGDEAIAVRVRSRIEGDWPYGAKSQPLLVTRGGARTTRPLPVHPTTDVGRVATGRAADDGGQRRRRVIVVGAGTGGHYLLPALRHSYEVLAFVDDAPRVARVGDIEVKGTIDELETLIDGHKPVDQIIFAIPTASGITRNRVLQAAHRCGVDLVTLPSMFELRHEHPMVPQLRPFDVFETFGAFSWHVDRHAATLVRDRRVAIVGAGSWIGTALARSVARGQARHLLLLDSARQPLKRMIRDLRDHRNCADVEGRMVDYVDSSEMAEVFADHPPEVVFHCAMLNYAPESMLRPSHAVRANVLAAHVVADTAERAGAREFVLASADRAAHRFTMFDRTKTLAEVAVLSHATPRPAPPDGLFLTSGRHHGFRVSVLRLPNVWARDGVVVGGFIDQLRDGGPVHADPSVVRKFIPAWEAAQALLRLLERDDDQGLYAYQGGEVLDLSAIAVRLIAVQGLVADRDIAIDRRPRGDTKAGVHVIGEGEAPLGAQIEAVVAIEQNPALKAELSARFHLLMDALRRKDAVQRDYALSDEFVVDTSRGSHGAYELAV